ncbi:MAG TPA: Mth938-like domain-containing protein [Stellaceae bacterium]|nr:Mth938-like domain-containing protein [Stellaceae bacterium]
MELTRIMQAGRQVIERYGASGFRISGTIFLGPVLVFPDRTLDWPDAEISIEGLAPVTEHGDIELLLLGLGRRMAPVAAQLRTPLKAAGIALEAMDTGAACRTYNLLIAEDRRVAAALLPPV